jgi:excisionase family DNA binding protein
MARATVARPRKDPDDFAFERKPFYSPAELSRILGVSDQTVLDLIHGEKLFAVQVGPRLYRIPLGAFMQFLGVPPRIRWTRRSRAVVRADDDELDRRET